MENGAVLGVEYKNSRDWDLPENVEKRQIGELWEKRSNGKCFFIMPKGKDFESIRQKALTAMKKRQLYKESPDSMVYRRASVIIPYQKKIFL
jgi:hypothetical protein